MSPEERERVVIEGTTKIVIDEIWPWMRQLPFRRRRRFAVEIQDIVKEEYRKVHHATDTGSEGQAQAAQSEAVNHAGQEHVGTEAACQVG